jgi:pimeloyl-ACP methyl ester carboxylesterase
MSGRTGTERLTPRREGGGWTASPRPGLPPALRVIERPPKGGWNGYHAPVVVLVHGSLDRATSFGRTALRLPDLALVTYDRRGYQGSRAGGAASLRSHVDDLVGIAEAYAAPGRTGAARGASRPVVAVGHSIGGTLVLWAAVSHPDRLASVGAYEPSMPWLGFHRPRRAAGGAASGDGTTEDPDPGLEAERFFRRMVGDEAWQRLAEHERASRRADGPALLEDVRGIRGATPFDVTTLRVPAVVAAGGSASFPHHQQTVEWLGEHVPSICVTRVPDAGHGAHLSHPDAFAGLVRQAVALA